MTGWKYSKERLKKHPYVAKVLYAKKVICVYDVMIKLLRKWDEDYINHHTRSKGCTQVEDDSVRAKECNGYVDKNHHDKICYTASDKAIKGVFNDKPIFTGLYHIMIQACLQKENSLAGHIITYLINNENPKTRFITQREKRWKTNRKTMAAKLAQHHKEKLARNKKSKNKKKQNVNSVVCK
ncbi:18406_t:CDS:2, partial [Funneliformis geosporum]